MADISLVIRADASGAVTSVRQFNAEVDKAPAAASRAGAGIDSLTKSFETFAANALGVGVGIGLVHKGFEVFSSVAREIVGTMSDAAKSLGEYGDKIGTLAERTGLSVSSLQVFNALAKTSGTDVDALAKAAVKMDYAMGLGDQSFKRLGLSISELQRMSPDAAFTKVATAIGALEDPMKRASAAMAIFGKSGAELLPVFTSDLEAARKQAEDFGLVLDEGTVMQAKKLGDALETTKMSLDAFLMRLAGVVSNTPAVMQAVEGMSGAFGSMSKALDENAKTFQKWANIAALALTELAADLATELGMIVSIGKYGSMGWLVQLSGVERLTDGLKNMAQSMQDAVIAKMKWQAIDMGGKGVLLPGHELGKQGGGMGDFANLGGGSGSKDNAFVKAAVEARKAWDDFYSHITNEGWKAGQSIIAGLTAGNRAAMPLMEKNILAEIPKKLAVPFGLDGKVRRYSFDNSVDYSKKQEKASLSASQALQNLANIAQLSGSKLAKGLASIFGGGAGIGTGLSAFKNAGSGITGLLGKVGGVASIASAGISLVSGIFGLFKKKPKEPPPEPPKQATAQAWSSFVTDQQSKGAAGVLAGVSGIKVTSPQDMAAQASIASQSFWAMFKEQGLVKAADAFKAVRDKMVETFKAAGADDSAIGAMLGPMSQVVDLAGNDAFRGAADGANGFSEALAAIANQQLPMTVDQFNAFQEQAVTGYEQMKQAAIDQGMSLEEATKNAAVASGQYLTTLKDAAAKYGLDLGDGTKAILGEAQAAGVAFGTSSQDRLIMSLDALTETLGGAPPKFEQAMTSAANQAGNSIGVGGRLSQQSEAGGIGGNSKELADSIGTVINEKFNSVADKLAAALKSQPIDIRLPDINLDGNSLLSGLAGTLEGGGPGAQRFQTAAEGR